MELDGFEVIVLLFAGGLDGDSALAERIAISQQFASCMLI